MGDPSAACCAAPAKSTSGRLPTWATRDRLMLAGGIVVIGGLALNRGWPTAIGLAPVLLAVVSCGVMCALGLCAMGMQTPHAPATPPAK